MRPRLRARPVVGAFVVPQTCRPGGVGRLLCAADCHSMCDDASDDGSLDDDELLREAEALQRAHIEQRCTLPSDESLRLQHAIAGSLLTSEDRAWEIQQNSSCGRHLIAKQALAAGTVVFREQPLVVGEASTSGSALLEDTRTSFCAAAIELLRLPADSPARLLQESSLPAESRLARILDVQAGRLYSTSSAHHDVVESLDGCTVEDVRWALGVATCNAHDAVSPDRAVVGVLASMMEHSCDPCCRVSIGSTEDESVITLIAKRDVQPGESLTISYVPTTRDVAQRQAALSFQHGFVCACQRCTVELAIARMKQREADRDEAS